MRDALVERNAHLRRIAGLSTEAERRAYRVAVTRADPLMFGLIYLRAHLGGKDTSLSVMHEDWATSALSLMWPCDEPASDRRAEVAPRESGKSTIHFLVVPMWAAAHGHIRFVAAFSSAATQAEGHLATFKHELDNNPLIRADFPELTQPMTRGRGTVEADRVSLYRSRSGFTFAAAGMDSSSLGLKVGEVRPDLILLDDIEPHEGMYSADQAKKRRSTLLDAILPLNIYAHVILVGTVTMVGSIIHQLVRYGRGERTDEGRGDELGWIESTHFETRHFPPIITLDDGTRASIWPEKWPLSFLEGIEGTAQYAKNYANDPLGAEGDYWTLDDIRRTANEDARLLFRAWGVTRILVSVDPAVTTKKSSDYTGLAVIGWSPSLNRCIVIAVIRVRMSGAEIRRKVLALIEEYNAGLVLVETNQGGDLWALILHDMPVKVKSVHQSESKEIRAADVLDHYQRGRVYHLAGAKLTDFEGELVAFPNAPHDDMVDAAGSGIRYFLSRGRGKAKPTGAGVYAVS